MKDFGAILALILLVGLTILTVYEWLFAIIALLSKRFSRGGVERPLLRSRFVVVIPAHNEELCLRSALESLRAVTFPTELIKILVVADRCTDRTRLIAEGMGVDCYERNTGAPGKGPAIAWALEEISRKQIQFDALVILDADTVVDPQLFDAFNISLNAGHVVQQGYCYISNPWQSAFTRIIAVTSTMRNGLFYAGKTAANMPGILAGTGMCFRKDIIDRYGWPAFSVGEDWEFSAVLLLAGEKIYFNPLAKVFQLESIGLQQASKQRLRWAGGRYAVIIESAWALMKKGMRERSAYIFDGGLTLLAPNYSTQASLAIVGVAATWLLKDDPVWSPLYFLSCGVFVALFGYFALGSVLTKSPLKVLQGMMLIPVFLPWRLVIEVLGILGYGRRHWSRTARVQNTTQVMKR